MDAAAQNSDDTGSVHNALIKDQLKVAFQPIIDLRTWTTFGYEALLRSDCETMPGPLDVLRVAVAEKYIGKLGRALRQKAIDSCPQVALFLNIHPDEFDDRWLVQPNDPLLWHEGDVYLEITESVPLSHYKFCHSVLSEIRDKGVRLAVDDLGAGYSNLLYIADLSPEVVKIDRELIADIHTDSRRRQLVKSICQLCHQMGARVVAEGIENVDELEVVLESGAHFGQGYFFARPSFDPPDCDWRGIYLSAVAERSAKK